MNIDFYKYQGTGNDFVIIDNRKQFFDKANKKLIARICHRKFGIGADGLILLESSDHFDFEMVYFNADGKTSSMCGNGGRCIMAFAKKLGLIDRSATFLAIDGEHEAKIESNNEVALKMNNVRHIEVNKEFIFLDTGSPHYVAFVEDTDIVNVKKEGSRIRNSNRFKAKGTNVNFVSRTEEGIKVRTYERGVENETLSCGTGVTAVAISAAVKGWLKGKSCLIITKGGNLTVSFNRKEKHCFENIWLTGPATFVFHGKLFVDEW